MSLTDVSFIREDQELKKSTPTDPFIQKRIREGARRLKTWIGTDKYNWAADILAAQDTADENDLDDALTLQQIESKLVMYFAIPSLNLRVTEQGIIMASESRHFKEAVYRVATPKEIEGYRKQFYKDAWSLCAEFVPGGTGVLPVGS